jgi:CDP-paratose 2-epimerase
MKVLVTGGCGFLGSHVCEYYATRGHQVTAFDNMTKLELMRTGFAVEEARDYNTRFLKSLGVSVVVGDVRVAEQVLEHANGIGFIVHTAAQPAMTISCEDPGLDFGTNVVGTVNVLNAARKHKIPVVSCATIHIYGNEINHELTESPKRYVRQPAAIDERYPTLQGTLTPLHASKAAGDAYVRVYADTYGVDAASFRLTGIYGTRQFGGEDHGWVANFAIRALLGWPITLYGTGKQVRDIIYATDICEAFDAFYKSRKSGVYNIGGGESTAISLLECIEILEDLFSKKLSIEFGPARHGDLSYFVCDTSKARRELGWSPGIMPREGIARLVNWIKESKELFTQDKKFV